jgi:hypothetical protein
MVVSRAQLVRGVGWEEGRWSPPAERYLWFRAWHNRDQGLQLILSWDEAWEPPSEGQEPLWWHGRHYWPEMLWARPGVLVLRETFDATGQRQDYTVAWQAQVGERFAQQLLGRPARDATMLFRKPFARLENLPLTTAHATTHRQVAPLHQCATVANTCSS